MRITILMENTACRPALISAHGLSILVETAGQKLLVDVGPGEQFAENAAVLGVNLSQIDLCVISHGHYDHGGGLKRFLRDNTHAPVYLTKTAFEPHFSPRGAIGLDAALQSCPQMHFTGQLENLSECFTLFSEVPGETLLPPANAGLTDETGPDSFAHEQNLLVREGKQLYLFGGCAHRGIVNILEQARKISGRFPDVVISGFHLAAGGTGKCMAEETYLDALAQNLLASNAMFYTGHCTGSEAFAKLKARMGDHLEAISTGMVLEWN